MPNETSDGRGGITALALPGTSDLEALTDPGKRIILSCERAKEWLAQALDGDDIELIAELKSQAEAIRVYTIQKQLGKDAELSAAEIVRRAERCIGLAIRKGQAEGRIRRRGQGRGYTQQLPKPTDFASHDELMANSAGIYDVTDGVSDDQFEKAIGKGKAEHNLSRANVVRKARGDGGADLWEALAELAATGHTSHQIARALGAHRETILKKAADRGVVIHADRVVGRSHIPKPDRILREFVGTLESLVPSCELIDPSRLAPSVLIECVPIMVKATKALRKLERRLKEAIK